MSSPSTRKGLKEVLQRDLLNLKFPRREHLLAPWLRVEESALVWAPSGLGKTLLTWSVSLAIAGAGKVLGWQAPKARRVLIVDGEMAVDDLVNRVRMLAPTIDGLDLATATANISVLSRQYQSHRATFPDLASKEGSAMYCGAWRGSARTLWCSTTSRPWLQSMMRTRPPP